jgi:hypothetical protein
MSEYCPTCGGDPRRPEHAESHKLHAPPTLPDKSALPDKSEEDWLNA